MDNVDKRLVDLSYKARSLDGKVDAPTLIK